jgi:hypothetical protein
VISHWGARVPPAHADVKDKAGNPLAADKIWTFETKGCSPRPEEFYADPHLGHKMVHPDDRHIIDEVLRSPESPITIRWRRKNGELLWSEQRNKPIYDEAGELVAIEGIGRDVTDCLPDYAALDVALS